MAYMGILPYKIAEYIYIYGIHLYKIIQITVIITYMHTQKQNTGQQQHTKWKAPLKLKAFLRLR